MEDYIPCRSEKVTIRIRWLYILTAWICIIPCALLCVHWLHKGFHDNLKSATKFFANHISNIWDKRGLDHHEIINGAITIIAVIALLLGPEMLVLDLIILLVFYFFLLLIEAFLGVFYLFFALLFVSEKVFILTALLGILIGLGLNRITIYTIAYHILIAVGSLWVGKVALTINVGGRHVRKERQG
jgi:hypothetical protein